MNVDTGKMQAYANFLEDKSANIIELCNRIEENLMLAVQCMDQQSGRGAAQRLAQNLENIKASVPISDDACKRLNLSLKHVNNAGNVFGGR